MATVGAKLTIPFIVGAGQIVGQGNQPELWAVYTTDDVSNTSPTWLDASQKVRQFSVSRGRESELSEFDAGSASLTLDNRTRTFDPNSNALITPLNRWWLREQFTGETEDLFKGYAETYDNQWPNGFDAECVVTCGDEFKLLTWMAMPGFSPQRSSYSEVIASDLPASYWRLNEDPVVNVQPAASVEPAPISPNPPPKATWPYFGRPSFGYRPP